ncbi:MAG: OadG family protein [Selenomonadaceae bacterium]|nr:OadG family protein [Selenomonadaceae bacterium]
MSQPVTTNPLIIMCINMTVVFVVLVSLSFLIKLIHAIDPTKQPEVKSDDSEHEEDAAKETAAIISKLQEEKSAPVVEEGISPEIIAVITAAIASCGVSGQVRAVHVVNNSNSTWRQNSPNKILSKK